MNGRQKEAMSMIVGCRLCRARRDPERMWCVCVFAYSRPYVSVTMGWAVVQWPRP